jgi:hypothetical protein
MGRATENVVTQLQIIGDQSPFSTLGDLLKLQYGKAPRGSCSSAWLCWTYPSHDATSPPLGTSAMSAFQAVLACMPDTVCTGTAHDSHRKILFRCLSPSACRLCCSCTLSGTAVKFDFPLATDAQVLDWVPASRASPPLPTAEC